MEVRKQVIPYVIDYRCPICDEGYMRPVGTVLTTSPPQIPHGCNNDNCQHIESFVDVSYPYMDYEDTGVETLV